jgi:hypothetical protein
MMCHCFVRDCSPHQVDANMWDWIGGGVGIGGGAIGGRGAGGVGFWGRVGFGSFGWGLGSGCFVGGCGGGVGGFGGEVGSGGSWGLGDDDPSPLSAFSFFFFLQNLHHMSLSLLGFSESSKLCFEENREQRVVTETRGWR